MTKYQKGKYKIKMEGREPFIIYLAKYQIKALFKLMDELQIKTIELQENYN